VASERQIAANRANARKSSGPRSSAGKSRASRNAYRHGLSLSVGTNAPLAPQLETLARKIAGNAVDAITLERAREIAQAEFDLARVRRAKVALIESARACAAADRPPMPHTIRIDRLKPSDGCCQNYVSWSDTSAALLRGETERFSILW